MKCLVIMYYEDDFTVKDEINRKLFNSVTDANDFIKIANKLEEFKGYTFKKIKLTKKEYPSLKF